MQTYQGASKGVIFNSPALIKKFQSKRVLSFLSTNNRLIILTQSQFFVLNPYDQLFSSFLSVSAENIVRWAVNQHNEISILYADATLEIRMLDTLDQIIHCWKSVQFKVGRGFPKIYWQQQEIIILNETKIEIFNLKKKERKIYTDFVTQYESKSLLGLVQSGLIDDERVIVMHFTNKLSFNIVPIPITQLSISNITGFLSLASPKAKNFLTPQYLVLVLDNCILRVYNLINMKPLMQIQYQKVQDQYIDLTSDWKKEFLLVTKMTKKNKITKNILYKVNGQFYNGKNIREGSRFFQYEVEIQIKESLMIFPLSHQQNDGSIKIIDFGHIRHYTKREKGRGEVFLSRIAIDEDVRKKKGIRGCKIDFPGFPQLRQWKEIIESYIEMKNLFSQGGKRGKNVEKQMQTGKKGDDGNLNAKIKNPGREAQNIGQIKGEKQRQQQKREREKQSEKQKQALKQERQKQREKQKYRSRQMQEKDKLREIQRKKERQRQIQIQKEDQKFEKIMKSKTGNLKDVLEGQNCLHRKQKQNDAQQLEQKYERLKNCIIEGALKYQLEKQKNSPTGQYQYQEKQFYGYMKQYLKNEDFQSDAQLLFTNFKINQSESIETEQSKIISDEQEIIKYLSDEGHGDRKIEDESTKMLQQLLLEQTKSAEDSKIGKVEVRQRYLSENKIQDRSILMTNTDLNSNECDDEGFELDIMTKKISDAISKGFQPLQQKLVKISQQLNRIQSVNISQLKRCERVLRKQEKQMQNLDLTIKGFVRELLTQFEGKLKQGLQSYWTKIQQLDRKGKKQREKTMEGFSNFIDRQIKSRQDIFDQSRLSIQNHLVHLRKKMTSLFQRSFYPDEQDDYYDNQLQIRPNGQSLSDQGY